MKIFSKIMKVYKILFAQLDLGLLVYLIQLSMIVIICIVEDVLPNLRNAQFLVSQLLNAMKFPWDLKIFSEIKK